MVPVHNIYSKMHQEAHGPSEILDMINLAVFVKQFYFVLDKLLNILLLELSSNYNVKA